MVPRTVRPSISGAYGAVALKVLFLSWFAHKTGSLRPPVRCANSQCVSNLSATGQNHAPPLQTDAIANRCPDLFGTAHTAIAKNFAKF